MTVQQDLMNAILSMDAYNRGYNAGIQLEGDALGSIQIMKTTLDGVVVNFDSSVIRDPVTKQPLDQNIGFYAIAYAYDSNGDGTSDQTIISYRGSEGFDKDPVC